MQVTLQLSDKVYPFEKMLDVIRKKNPLPTVEVEFHRDGAGDLFYRIEGDLVDAEKVRDVIFGK